MPTSDSVYLVIPAAGVGSRMQADKPKQYLPLLGKTVLEQTLDAFAGLSELSGTIVATSSGDPYWQRLMPQLAQNSLLPLYSCEGGVLRADTVLLALRSLQSQIETTDPWVLVHDAARPCVQLRHLQALLAIRNDESVMGGILATPVADTLKRAGGTGQIIDSTYPRGGLWQAQTPQLFRMNKLIEALNRAVADGVAVTDEASAMEYCGHVVGLVEGSASNLKITRPDDLLMAEAILQQRMRKEV